MYWIKRCTIVSVPTFAGAKITEVALGSLDAEQFLAGILTAIAMYLVMDMFGVK